MHSDPADLHGNTVESGITAERINEPRVGDVIATHPGVIVSQCHPGTLTSVPETMWQGHHATSNVWGDLDMGDDRSDPTCNSNALTFLPTLSLRVFGIDHQGAPIPALHQSMKIMHPGIAIPDMPAANQTIPLVCFRQLLVHAQHIIKNLRDR
jgi:hypothetical protein